MKSELYHRKRVINKNKNTVSQNSCNERNNNCEATVKSNNNQENVNEETATTEAVCVKSNISSFDSSLLSNDSSLILPGASPKSSFIQKFYYDGYYFDQFHLNYSGFMKADGKTILDVLKSSLCLSIILPVESQAYPYYTLEDHYIFQTHPLVRKNYHKLIQKILSSIGMDTYSNRVIRNKYYNFENYEEKMIIMERIYRSEKDTCKDILWIENMEIIIAFYKKEYSERDEPKFPCFPHFNINIFN